MTNRGLQVCGRQHHDRIEEEYLLVNPETRELARHQPEEFIKPRDAAGAAGTYRANNKEELIAISCD